MTKKLSIIISHYNTPNYLNLLLNSIPSKDEIQTIVIDDKSDNNIEEYNHLKKLYNHVDFIDNTTNNKNAGVCRNIGLKHAVGDWVLFADADDYFVEGFYENIEKYFNSDNDVVFFAPTSIDRENGNISYRHLRYYELLENYLKKPNKKNTMNIKLAWFVPWSKLIKREFIKRNNIIFDEIKVSNDMMFSAKIGCFISKFEVSEDVVYCVVNSRGSLTKQINIENFNIRFDAFIRMYNFIRETLNKKDYNIIRKRLLGIQYIWNSVMVYKLGFKKTFNIIKILKNNKIMIIHISYINPVKFTKNLKYTLKREKESKKHYIYESSADKSRK